MIGSSTRPVEFVVGDFNVFHTLLSEMFGRGSWGSDGYRLSQLTDELAGHGDNVEMLYVLFI